ncbi:MAG: hypothetical protein HZA81_01845, partial [Candidatus Taylorbacteria bacterium]|nr:hypothetical protein [Candidatus Taylorbacteria bacterium]
MIGRSWYVCEESLASYQTSANLFLKEKAEALKAQAATQRVISAQEKPSLAYAPDESPLMPPLKKVGIEKLIDEPVMSRVAFGSWKAADLSKKAVAATLSLSLVLGAGWFTYPGNAKAALGAIASGLQRVDDAAAIAMIDFVGHVRNALGINLAAVESSIEGVERSIDLATEASESIVSFHESSVSKVGDAIASAFGSVTKISDGFASLAAVGASQDSFLERIARGVYESIHALFGGKKQIARESAPAPLAETKTIVAQSDRFEPVFPEGVVPATSTEPDVYAPQAVTVPATAAASPVVNNYYSTEGMSAAEVKALISASESELRSEIAAAASSAARATGNARNAREDNSVGDQYRPVIREATIKDAKSLSVAGDTTLSGGLSGTSAYFSDGIGIGGSLNASGGLVVSGAATSYATNTAPSFAATSTAATSTFAGGIAIGDTGFVFQQATKNIGIGTTSPDATISLLQSSNGTTMISAYRATDIAPSGDFINYKSNAGTTLFRVDNSGNLLAGGIINTGSQTVTSVSGPQFRIQYDASNEFTTTVSSSGTTTLALNGTTPSLAFTPQSNQRNTFDFTNAAGTSILSIDTQNRRVGIGTTSPSRALDVVGVGGFHDPSGSGSYFRIGADSTGSYFEGDPTGRPVSFWVGGAEKVRFSTTSVGIGTTSPSAKLSIEQNAGETGFVVGSSTQTSFIVDAKGNVGVNMTNPNPGDFGGGALGVRGRNNSTTGSLVLVGNNVTGTNPVGRVAFTQEVAGVNTNIAFIQALRAGADDAGDLNFMTKAAGGSLLERMRITSVGNIGIGTTTPGAKLSVNAALGDTNTTLFSISSSTSSGASTTFAVLNSNRVGIGTLTPSRPLQIWTTESDSIQVNRQGSFNIGDTVGLIAFQTGSGSGTDANAQVRSFVKQAGSEYVSDLRLRARSLGGGMRDILTADYTGNVGVGTTSPFAQLSVNPDGISGPSFAIGSSTRTNLIVTNGGNVGIGTSSPLTRLDVVDNGQVVAAFRGSNDHNTVAIDNLGGTSFKNQLSFRTQNTEKWAIGNDINANGSDNFYIWNATGGRTPFSIDGTANTIVLSQSGSYKVGVSSTTPWAQLSLNPNGITGPSFVVGSSTKTDFIVTNAGRVGIGTTTPQRSLHVVGNGAIIERFGATPLLVLRGGPTSATGKDWKVNVDQATSNLNFVYDNVGESNNQFAMGIDTNGNLGIGTTTPGARLAVTGNALVNGNLTVQPAGNGPQLNVLANGSGNDTEIVIGDGLGSFWNLSRENSVGNVNRGDLTFESSAAGTVLSLENSGTVGIGTTTSASGLTIASTTAASTYFQGLTITTNNATSWGNYMIFARGGTSNRGLVLGEQYGGNLDAPTIRSAGSVSQDLEIRSGRNLSGNSGVIYFNTGGDSTAQIYQGTTTITTDLSVSGEIGVGTTSPWAKLSVNQGAGDVAFAIGSSTRTSFIVAANGHVGIGTTTPPRPFYLQGTSDGTIGVQTTATNNYTGINLFDVDSNLVGSLGYGNSAAGVFADTVFVGSRNATAPLAFVTGGSSERMRITPTGNVGIGTTSPSALFAVEQDTEANSFMIGNTGSTTWNGLASPSLVVKGVNGNGRVGVGVADPAARMEILNTSPTSGINEVLRLSNGFTTGALNEPAIRFDNSLGTNWWSISAVVAGGAQHFRIGKSLAGDPNTLEEYIRIVGSDGNLGVGTTSPWAKLSASSTSSYPALAIEQRGAGAAAVFLGGNVGIGTTSPTAKLHVYGSGGIEPIIQSSNSYSGITLVGGQAQDGANGYGIYSGYPTAGNFSIGENGVGTRLTIQKTTGNVGIGTTTPSAMLHVAGSGSTSLGNGDLSLKLTGTADNTYSGFNIYSPSNSNQFFAWAMAGSTTADMRFGLPTANGAFIFANGPSGQTVSKLAIGLTTDAPIYLANANTIRLTIASTTGNVGIGTTTPATRLEISTPASGSGVDGPTLRLTNAAHGGPTGAGNLVGGLDFFSFDENVSGLKAQIKAIGDASGNWGPGGNSRTNLFLAGSDSGSQASGLTVNYAGNVGIGTTSPTTRLETVQAGTNVFRVTTTGTLGGTRNLIQLMNAGSTDNGWELGYNTDLSSQDFRIREAVNNVSSYMFTIQHNTGNVGIGTTTPQTKLHTYGASGNILSAVQSGARWLTSFTNDSGNPALYSDASSDIRFGKSTLVDGTGFAEAMRITSGGNVGIGTTTPSRKLEVYAGASGAGSHSLSNLVIEDSGTSYLQFLTPNTATQGILFGDPEDSARGGLFYNHTADSFDIRTAGTNGVDLIVSSSGNVGVGTSTPNAKLEVSGTGASTDFRVSRNNVPGYYTAIFAPGGSNTNSEFMVNGAHVLGLQGNTSGVGIGNSYSTGIFMAPTNGLMVEGNVGIGTTSPFAKLSVAGNAYFDGSITASNITATGTMSFGTTTLTNLTVTNLSTSTFAGPIVLNSGIAKDQGLSVRGVNYDKYLEIQRDNVGGEFLRIIGAAGGSISGGGNNAFFFDTIGPNPSQTRPINWRFSSNGGTSFDTALTLTPFSRLTSAYPITVSTTTATSTFSTGGLTVGTSQFVVQQSSGNIGIGTAAPAALLDVSAGATGKGGEIVIRNTVEALNNYAALSFNLAGATSNYQKGAIYYVGNGTGNGRGDIVFAQNSVAASESVALSSAVMTIKNNGNVGIGTTSPMSSLAVSSPNGNVAEDVINVFGGATSNTLHTGIKIWNNTGADSVALRNVIGASGFNRFGVFVKDNAGNPETERLSVLSSGNVGIGTSSPAAKLDVAGSVLINGAQPAGNRQLSINHATQASLTYQLNGTEMWTTYGNASFGIQQAGVGDRLTISSAGNIGIGTTSPYAKLSVVGEVVARNFTATSTTATTTIAGGLDVGNGAIRYDWNTGLTSIDNATIGSLNFETNAGIVNWADMLVTSAASAGTAQSYSASVNGNPFLTVYSESDGAGGLQNSGVGVGSSTPWAYLSVNPNNIGSTRPSFAIGSSTKTDFIVTNAGRVGIGTTSPYANLSIAGTSARQVLQATTGDATLVIQGQNAATQQIARANTSVASAIYFQTAGANDWAIGLPNWSGVANSDFRIDKGDGTTKFTISASTSNVGIGTTTPLTKLAIGVAGVGTEAFSLQDGSRTTATFSYNASTGENRIGGVASYAFPTFYSGNAEAVRITTGGNVGIGTTTPLGPLDVYGTGTVTSVYSNGSQAADFRAQAGTRSNEASLGLFQNEGGYRTYGNYFVTRANTSNLSIVKRTNNADTEVITIANSTGNVGIGTTTPQDTLTITSPNRTTNYGGGAAVQIGAYSSDAVAIDKGGQIALGGTNGGCGANCSTYAFGTIAGRKENSTIGNLAGYLQFSTTDTGSTIGERMRITSTGNVGIGTTTPQNTLSVQAGAAIAFSATSNGSNAVFKLQNYAVNGWAAADVYDNAGSQVGGFGYGNASVSNFPSMMYMFSGSGKDIAIQTNGAGSLSGNGIYVKSSGNVGVGTTSPQQKFDVWGAANTEIARFTGNGSGNRSFGIGTYTPNSGGANLFVNGVAAMSLHALQGVNIGAGYTGILGPQNGLIVEGNLGIGTTSPYARLSVVGEAVARNFTATSTSATSTFAGGLDVGNGAIRYDW